MISVACCNCMRIMSPEGKPLGERVGHGGLMNILEIVHHFESLKDAAATFSDKVSADLAAIGFGWQAIGGDHRCPECRIVADRDYLDRQGCYIEWPEANK